MTASDADVDEQATPAGADDASPQGHRSAFAMPEVNEADAADQERAVEFDEDEYR